MTRVMDGTRVNPMTTKPRHRSNVISVDEFLSREISKTEREGSGPHPVFQGKNGSGKTRATIGGAILAASVEDIPDVQFAIINIGDSAFEYGIYDMLPQIVDVYDNPSPRELDAIISAIIDSREEYPDSKHLYLMMDTSPVLQLETAQKIHTLLQRIESEGDKVGVTAVVYPGYGLRDRAA